VCLDYENQEHLCERPGFARIAAGGEPGERGRYEDRNMLLRTTDTGQPRVAGPQRGCQNLTAQFSPQATRGCQNLTAQFRHQAYERHGPGTNPGRLVLAPEQSQTAWRRGARLLG